MKFLKVCLLSSFLLGSFLSPGIAIANQVATETGEEVQFVGRINSGQIFPILRARVTKEALEGDRVSYRIEGHGVTDDELNETLPEFRDKIIFPIQGDFVEEFVLSPPYFLESYSGEFQFRDLETGWLIPVKLTILRNQEDIHATMLLGNDLSYVDLFDGPLDLDSSEPFLVISPSFLLGIGMEELLESDSGNALPMINSWISFFQPDSDPLIIHPVELQPLGEIQLQSQSADGAIIPSREIALRFGDSLIWKLAVNRANELLNWSISTPDASLSIWRSDLFPDGLELLDEVNQAWINQVAFGIAILALFTALGIAVFMRRRWIIPLKELSSSLVMPASKRELGSISPSSPKEVSQIQRAYLQVEERAETSETLREQLISDVAHELRTPLSVIRADLEALIDEVYEPSQEKLLTLHDKTMLLQRLVEDLHELTLAQSGELTLESTKLDLNELLHSASASFKTTLDEEGLELRITTQEGLPPIHGDRARLQQVLFNLLENARRHSDSGGKISISTHINSSDLIEISIEDEGDGIEPSDLEHIFERFYRGDLARSREKGGSGLGLTIAKYVVEAHGGKLWAESAGPGLGSKFSFSLPISKTL